MSLLRLESQQQRRLKTLFNEYFSSLSYLFGIETITTSIHSRSFQENHTRFQTKMGKVCTCFQIKTAQKSSPLGWHPTPPLRKLKKGLRSRKKSLTILRSSVRVFLRHRPFSNGSTCRNPQHVSSILS